MLFDAIHVHICSVAYRLAGADSCLDQLPIDMYICIHIEGYTHINGVIASYFLATPPSV